MEQDLNIYARGSEWRKWDLHLHTNASDGEGTCADILTEAKAKGLSCIAVTDHHTFDNVDTMKELAAPVGITVISGVEFRTEYGKESVHMIGLFPDEYNGIKLTAGFLHDAILSPLGVSRSIIIENGRKSKPSASEEACFKEGMFQVQVEFKEAAKLIHKYGGLVTVHAGEKSNSIEGMKHAGKGESNTTIENALGTLKEELFKEGYIDICDMSNPKEAAFYLKTFAKPSITTSDAHKIKDVGVNACWIKADPTFHGLRQILIEPDRISYEEPDILQRIKLHPDKFVANLQVKRTATATMPEVWFDNIQLPINPGMVVIIGNKGSGKSAIADILALCANTTNEYMSFLTPSKFRMNKPYNRSKQIEASIQWADKSLTPLKTLDTNPDPTQPERIKYIPQNFLETICTTTDDRNFEDELKKIIFQYLQPSDRYGQNNLDEIIEYLTEESDKSCELIRKNISEINAKIINLELMLDPAYMTTLQNKKKYKQDQLSNTQMAKPVEVERPNAELDANAQAAKQEIDALITEIENTHKQIEQYTEFISVMRKNMQDLASVKENFNRLQIQINESLERYGEVLRANGIEIKSVMAIEYHPEIVDVAISKIESNIGNVSNDLYNEANGIIKQQEQRKLRLAELQKSLSEPERRYQEYLKLKQAWEKQIEDIVGTPEKEDTIKYYQAQIEYVEHHLHEDLSKFILERKEYVKQLMDKKQEVLTTYFSLFAPVVDFIKKYSSEMNDYPIEFDAAFMFRDFEEHFLDYINQQSSGSFYGKEQGMMRLTEAIDNVDVADVSSIIDFSESINEALLHDKRDGANNSTRNVSAQLRKVYTQKELYDYLYGMEYVVPFFQLKMNGKPLASLSPGERGALLLLLYLFIDMDDKPLIIDQPEENLDNESVYRYLVKFIRQAKKKRQIIIVTHNPNLAVVCDADQVIRMNIDKQNKNTVTCVCGAIENPMVNKQIVDVLEGTYPAFHNRDCKYIDKK